MNDALTVVYQGLSTDEKCAIGNDNRVARMLHGCAITDLQKLDHIAGELQITCHQQAKWIAEQDELLRQALEALGSIGDVYVNEDDDAGSCPSCHERSYRPHKPDCKLANAISDIMHHFLELSK